MKPSIKFSSEPIIGEGEIVDVRIGDGEGVHSPH